MQTQKEYQEYIKNKAQAARKVLDEFREFAVKGNAVDLAVGVVIGAAFGKIVSSLVGDIIMPPLSFLIGGIDFKDLVWKVSKNGTQVAVLNYGNFLNSVVDFLIVGFSVFMAVKLINKLKKSEPAPAAVINKQEELLTEIRDLLKKEQSVK